MDIMQDLTFAVVVWLGVAILRLNNEVKEIRKLLEEVLLLSRKADNNQSILSKE